MLGELANIFLSVLEIEAYRKMVPNRLKNEKHPQSEGERNTSRSSSITSHIYKYSDDFKNRWKIDKGIVIESNFEKYLQNADKNAKKKIERLKTYVKNEKLSLEEESDKYYLLTFSAEFRPHEHLSTGVIPSFVPVNFKIWLDRKNSVVISVGANKIQSQAGIALLSYATTANPYSIHDVSLEKKNFIKLQKWILSKIKGQIKGITICDIEYEGGKCGQITLNQLENFPLSDNLLNSASKVKNLSFTIPLSTLRRHPLNCRITHTGEVRIDCTALSEHKLLKHVEMIIKATGILLSRRKPTRTGSLRKQMTGERTSKKKQPSSEEGKVIDLGKGQKRSKVSSQPRSIKTEGAKSSEREAYSAAIKSPFSEINLDEAKIFFVLPRQSFKFDDKATSVLQQLDYRLEINGAEQTITATVNKDEQGSVRVEERRIELKKPLETFQVVFPDELQGRTYGYKHSNLNFYAFTAIGNNRGRMLFLSDSERNINSIPKKDVWILLREDFELVTEPDVIEERWIWGNYWPLRINLKNTSTLTIKNRRNDEKEKMSCEASFSIEGEHLVEDDLKEQSPLLFDKYVKIKAPRENPSGWNVWIQSKFRECEKPINWNGIEPLTLNLPEDLPGEYGEFQVDICQQDTGISEETLFFRWIPSIELEYPKNLIIPDPERGHTVGYVKVELDNIEEWKLKTVEDMKIESTEANSYRIEIPPANDVINFSVSKKRSPENEIPFKVTIPRLRWITSKQDVWGDKLQKIERKDFISGETFYLFVQTNDFNKYDLLATIETNGQKLQEEKFARKGMESLLELNRFKDTIENNKDEIKLKIEVQRKALDGILGSVEALCFPALSMLDPAYYKDKKSKEDFTKDEMNFLNQIFDVCGKVLCTKTIIRMYEEGKVSLPGLFKPYIKGVREKEKYFDEDILGIHSPIDFSFYKERDFEKFFKELKEIILLSYIMDLWFYGYITIPMIPRTIDALLFYFRCFEEKEKIRYIFKRERYQKEIIDDELSALLRQAHVSLYIKEELENFEKDFAKNPEYRRHLFFNDLFNPGNTYYLVEKWEYYKAKDGNLSRMPSNSDQLLLGDEVMEEVKNMRFKVYIKHRGSREMTLRYRTEQLDFLNTTDKDRALGDALNFFIQYCEKEGDKNAN